MLLSLPWLLLAVIGYNAVVFAGGPPASALGARDFSLGYCHGPEASVFGRIDDELAAPRGAGAPLILVIPKDCQIGRATYRRAAMQPK